MMLRLEICARGLEVAGKTSLAWGKAYQKVVISGGMFDRRVGSNCLRIGAATVENYKCLFVCEGERDDERF